MVLDPSDNVSKADFSSLEGVVTMFRDPNGVFCGWVHYVVVDLLVARMEVMDFVQRGASVRFHILMMIPCIILHSYYAHLVSWST